MLGSVSAACSLGNRPATMRTPVTGSVLHDVLICGMDLRLRSQENQRHRTPAGGWSWVVAIGSATICCVKTLFLVGLGGALGAISRHLVGLGATAALGRSFPYGTLVVNLLGSFMLGALVSWVARVDASPDIKLLVGTGLCGALTTFSTFSVESLQLLEQGHRGAALLNIALNLGLGLGAAFIGMTLLAR